MKSPIMTSWSMLGSSRNSSPEEEEKQIRTGIADGMSSARAWTRGHSKTTASARAGRQRFFFCVVAHRASVHKDQAHVCTNLHLGFARSPIMALWSMLGSSRNSSPEEKDLHRHRRRHVHCAVTDLPALRMTASVRAFQRCVAHAHRTSVHMSVPSLFRVGASRHRRRHVHLGIADGMSMARVWARRCSK